MTSSQAQASAADAVGRHQPVLLERCLDLLAPAIEGAAGSALDGGCEQVQAAFQEHRLVPADGVGSGCLRLRAGHEACSFLVLDRVPDWFSMADGASTSDAP